MENNQYALELIQLMEVFPPLNWVLTDEDGGPEKTIKAYKEGNPIPIYKGDSDDTIWGSPEMNWLFRAHHDSIHLEYEAPFTLQGEFMVSEIHSKMAESIGLYELARIMRIEVAGFAAYYEETGEHAPQELTEDILQRIKLKNAKINLWGGANFPSQGTLKEHVKEQIKRNIRRGQMRQKLDNTN